MFDNNKTWKQNILRVVGENNWRSYKQIFVALGLDIVRDRNKVQNIYPYISKLIRSGHLIKAHAPQVLKDTDPTNSLKYVYKGTGRKFVPKFVEPPTVGDGSPTKTSTKNKRFDGYKAYVAKKRLLE